MRAAALVTGATDARHYAGLSKNIYRFLPQRFDQEDIKRYHGINERISAANYALYVRFYHQLMRNSLQEDRGTDPGGAQLAGPGRRITGAAVALAVLLVFPTAGFPAPPRAEPEVVVLLHGLSRTPHSMSLLGQNLSAQGYRVVNLGYPGDREPIEELSQRLAGQLSDCQAGRAPRLHFVTHSMGGIVLRHYLERHRPENLGRVVMLSPPNGGSELVDLMKRVPGLRHHVGPSRQQLGTDASSLPARLGPVDFELGVIAGNRSWNPLFSWLLPGTDDGLVSLERTKVAGMSDFLAVPRSHTFIMRSREVITQTAVFLRRGAFDHSRRRQHG